MMLKLAVLDLDGTLTNTAVLHLRAWRSALADLGLPGEGVSVERLLGRRAIDIATALVGSGPLAWRLVRLKTMYYMEELSMGLSPFPCAGALLAESRGMGMRVAVVTSSSKSSATAVLRATGLMEFVDLLVAGDDVDRGKPDPAPVLLAVRSSGVEPWEAYGLGDTVYDVEAYRAAGLGLIMSLNPIDGAIHVEDLCEALQVVRSRSDVSRPDPLA